MKKDKKVRKYFDPDKVIDSSSNETDVPKLSGPETEELGPSAMILPDGCVYIGQFDGDLPHGEGILRWPDLSERFVGIFEKGNPKRGTLFLENKDCYEGEFRGGVYHGSGTLCSHDGQKWIGEFHSGKFVKGRIYFTNSDWYEGRLSNGLYEGYGTYAFCGGEKYVGYFREGKYHGQGNLRYSDGSSHEGEFENDRFVGNGDGIYRWPDGSYYVGEFRNGEFHGEGTVFDADGSVSYSGRYVYGALVKQYPVD